MMKSGGQTARAAKKAQEIVGSLMTGTEVGLPVTDHGESRLKNAVKYKLGNGHRLVTVEQAGKRIFLFVGTHDETDRWLEAHRNDQFVVDPKGSVRLLAVTETKVEQRPQLAPVATPDS